MMRIRIALLLFCIFSLQAGESVDADTRMAMYFDMGTFSMKRPGVGLDYCCRKSRFGYGATALMNGNGYDYSKVTMDEIVAYVYGQIHSYGWRFFGGLGIESDRDRYRNPPDASPAAATGITYRTPLGGSRYGIEAGLTAYFPFDDDRADANASLYVGLSLEK